MDFPTTTVKAINTCTCPDKIRPYKLEHELWSLQKAIQHTFNEALNKTHTMNIWSCGFDPQLIDNPTSDAIETRSAMTLYAMNDIFAPTKLLFYLNHPIIVHYRVSISSTSFPTSEQLLEPQPSEPQSLERTTASNLPSYFVLSDSHTKFMDPIITTPNYKLIIHSISGLRWLNSSDTNLCTYSLIQTSNISTYLRSSTAIMLLVGTNSLRYVDATQAVQQAAHTIDYIHQHHSHLNQKQSIPIVATFPCYKTTSTFPTPFSLLANIQIYNEALNSLSSTLNFTFIDFQIMDFHLAAYHMHLHSHHRRLISNSITNYFDALPQQPVSTAHPHKRSLNAIKRRNKIRHTKLKLKQH